LSAAFDFELEFDFETETSDHGIEAEIHRIPQTSTSIYFSWNFDNSAIAD
jgi:hypothetical protein